MELSACGLNCSDCQFLGKNCGGCNKVSGKTFWAVEHLPAKICPIFDCSINTKKLKNCGKCADLPCKIFTNLKDPAISDEEHQKSIQKRVAALKPGK